MKAMQLVIQDDVKSLHEAIIDRPQPRGEQVLVQVLASGVTATELDWYPTTHNKDGSIRLRAIPGHEFSGLIVEIGPQATLLQIGDLVYGMNDWFAEGSTADFCLADQHGLALKPEALSHEQAASVPIAALTAWQGLVMRAKLRSGERVLVQGGAGSVGAFAVQIAALQGAHVIATGSLASFDYMRSMGAAECIDYKDERFEQRISPVDVCFDTVGGDTLARSWPLLVQNGRMITIASSAELSPDPRLAQAFFIVEPNSHQLALISDLLASGHLRASVKTVLPFRDANKAYTKAQPGFGKTVLQIAP